MNNFTVIGTVDRKPVADVVNQSFPKYILTIAQEKLFKGKPARRLVRIDCGYPETLKSKMMNLNPGDQVVVTGEVESKPNADGTKFFTGLFAREISVLGAPLQMGVPPPVSGQAIDFDNVPF